MINLILANILLEISRNVDRKDEYNRELIEQNLEMLRKIWNYHYRIFYRLLS